MLHAMQFARLCEALEAAKRHELAQREGERDRCGAHRCGEHGRARASYGGARFAGDLVAARRRLARSRRCARGAPGATTDAAIIEASRRLGDLGDAAKSCIEKKREPPHAAPLMLADVDALEDGSPRGELAGQTRCAHHGALVRSNALEVKFLIKAMSGELRIGAAPGVVLLAIASAFYADETEVRRAHGLLADLAEVAVLAHDKALDEASCETRPSARLHARDAHRDDQDPPSIYRTMIAEEKLDGVRAQVHVVRGAVTIFARGLERVTESFPEVAAAFAGWTRDLVLDGEILAIGDGGRPRPFQALQMRLNRKKPSSDLLALVPVCFVAFDVLALGDDVLVDRPWSARRAALDGIARDLGKRTAFTIEGRRGGRRRRRVDAAFDRARKNGNEGLVLKRRDAPYEAGKRGQSWLKVKKATATLDVVVTAAEQGHGERANVISDYTFAVWKDGTLVDVGKAYCGLTDPEIDALSRHFVETHTSRRAEAGARSRPTSCSKSGFDGIQRSDRHASGFALRFPRILKVRDDKKPDECDTIETVEALYLAQVESGHREEPVAPPATKRKPLKSTPQLSLFGEDKKK